MTSSTPSRKWGDYTENELQLLIDNYQWLRFLKHWPAVHVRLMDLEVAMDHLPQKLYEAVVVYGLLRFTSRAAGEALHISHIAAQKRYRQGVDMMLDRLNGD